MVRGRPTRSSATPASPGWDSVVTLPSWRPVILIVDDDPAVRFMLRLWLEELGEEIEEVESGEAALERVARGDSVDVVVLDQRMPPGMSGIDVARTLRERGESAVILLHSAYLDEDVEAQAAKLGIPTIEKGDERGLRAGVEEALAPPGE